MALAGWGGLGLFAALPLFAAPAHERLYDGNRDEDDPCRMGLSQTEPHVEEPSDGGCRVDGLDQLRQVAPIDEVTNRVVNGNQKEAAYHIVIYSFFSDFFYDQMPPIVYACLMPSRFCFAAAFTAF